jgi:hypothetical protein
MRKGNFILSALYYNSILPFKLAEKNVTILNSVIIIKLWLGVVSQNLGCLRETLRLSPFAWFYELRLDVPLV